MISEPAFVEHDFGCSPIAMRPADDEMSPSWPR